MTGWMKNLIQFINGFRKWSIMMTLITVGVVFRVAGYLSGGEMVDLLQATAVAFMATNGIEHMSKSVIEWVKNKGNGAAK